MTLVDSTKDVVRSSVKVPEFDKHLKKAGGHIGQNVVEITVKMKTIDRKPFTIQIRPKISDLFVLHWSYPNNLKKRCQQKPVKKYNGCRKLRLQLYTPKISS